MTKKLLLLVFVFFSMLLLFMGEVMPNKANAEALSYTDEQLESYDVVYLDDLGLGVSYNVPAEKGCSYTPSASNTTGSLIFKFGYKSSDTTGATADDFAIRLATKGYDNKYCFKFKSSTWIISETGNSSIGNVFTDANKVYEVELGAIKLKDGAGTWLYIKVDGAIVLSKLDTCISQTVNGVHLQWAGQSAGTRTLTDLRYASDGSIKDEYLDKYDTLSTLELNAGDEIVKTTKQSANLTFTKGEDVPQGSFVFDFDYKHTASTKLFVRLGGTDIWTGNDFFMTTSDSSCPSGIWSAVFQNAGRTYSISNIFGDTTKYYNVQVGQIKLLNGSGFWFFIKVDGTVKLSGVLATANTNSRIALYVEDIANAEAKISSPWRFVTFDPANGSDSTLEKVDARVAMNAPTSPEKEEDATATYAFEGWYYNDGEKDVKWDFANAVNSSMTLTAHYTQVPKQFTATFNANGGSAVNPQTVNYGSKLLEVTTTKDYCSFIKWTYMDAGQEKVWDFDNDVLTKDITLKAVWSADSRYNEDGTMKEEYLDQYDVVYLDDLGLGATYNVPAEKGCSYTASALNTTGSLIFKFGYKSSDATGATADDFAIRLATKGYDNKYCFKFKSSTWIICDSGNASVANVFTDANKVYEVELGAIKLKDGKSTWLYIKVDGKVVLSKLDTCISQTVNGIHLQWTGQSVGVRTLTDLRYNLDGSLKDEYLDSYEVLSTHELNAGDEIVKTTKQSADLTFTKGEDIPQGSFVFNFDYKHTASTKLYVRLGGTDVWTGNDFFMTTSDSSCPSGIWSAVFQNAGRTYSTSNVFGDTDKYYNVQIGQIKLLNDNRFWFFIKVDGTVKLSGILDTAYTNSRIALYVEDIANAEAKISSPWRFVTFDPANGCDSTLEKIDARTVISAPTSPEKEEDVTATYAFEGWYYNDGEKDVKWDFANIVNSSMTLTAHYTVTPKQYTATFNVNGGSAVDSQTVNYGSKLSLVTTAKDHFTFVKWTYMDTEEEKVWDFDNDVLTKDITLTAVWADIVYDVTFVWGSKEDETKVVKVADGQTIIDSEIPTVTVSGYKFVKWVVGQADYDKTAPVTQNIMVSALMLKEVNVTFMNGSETVSTVKLYAGDKVTFPTTNPVKESDNENDYTFDGWFVGENKWNQETDVLGSEDVTLNAVYTSSARVYKLTVVDGLDENIEDVHYGDIIDLTKYNKDGYTLVVKKDGEVITSLEIKSNTEITLEYTKIVEPNKDVDKPAKTGCSSSVFGCGILSLLLCSIVIPFARKKKEE